MVTASNSTIRKSFIGWAVTCPFARGHVLLVGDDVPAWAKQSLSSHAKSLRLASIDKLRQTTPADFRAEIEAANHGTGGIDLVVLWTKTPRLAWITEVIRDTGVIVSIEDPGDVAGWKKTPIKHPFGAFFRFVRK